MTALLIDPERPDASGWALTRTPLAGAAGYDELWLQRLLHAHPALVPMDVIDPTGGALVPLALEFPLHREGGSSVFLDLLGVTPAGRVVLVECKLWRNPQARREVLAQLLEYAALLRGWTYADLTARLRSGKGLSGPNPIHAAALAFAPGLQEAAFVDAVSASLAAGDFHLVIVGDGIRSDLRTIAHHVNASGQPGRLSLVEVQLWSDPAGRVVVVPQLPLRTDVIEQRVFVGHHGAPLPPSAEAREHRATSGSEPVRRVGADRNRQFWQAFIDEVRFDHPEQTQPRHGGNNWVRVDLPARHATMTVYRTAGDIGLYVRFAGPDGSTAFDAVERDLDAIRQETGLALIARREGEEPFRGMLIVGRPFEPGVVSEAEQRDWLAAATNSAFTAIRPRLARWEAAADAAQDTESASAALAEGVG